MYRISQQQKSSRIVPRSTARIASAALGVVALAAAGCHGVEVAGIAGAPSGGTVVVGSGGGGGGGSTTSAIVGRWARSLVFTSDNGDINESRTEWEFRSDGSATRRVISTNFSAGIADTLVAIAQWRTTGSTLTISWLSPTVGTAVFDWRVSGNVLTIGSDQYTRTP